MITVIGALLTAGALRQRRRDGRPTVVTGHQISQVNFGAAQFDPPTKGLLALAPTGRVSNRVDSHHGILPNLSIN